MSNVFLTVSKALFAVSFTVSHVLADWSFSFCLVIAHSF